MSPAGCEGGIHPTSTLIMPILNMFKSRRGRSASLPRSPEGYWYDSEAHNPYGQRSTSGLSRAAHHAPHRASSRAPRYPAYGSSFPDSGAEPYAETLTDDQVRSDSFPRLCHDPNPNHFLHKCTKCILVTPVLAPRRTTARGLLPKRSARRLGILFLFRRRHRSTQRRIGPAHARRRTVPLLLKLGGLTDGEYHPDGAQTGRSRTQRSSVRAIRRTSASASTPGPARSPARSCVRDSLGLAR
jgi:hypothetical protein